MIVVVGRDADEVKERFAGEAEFVLQAEQNGTGHAVLVAMPTLGDAGGDVLVLYGDTPLLSPETLEQMAKVKRERGADLAVLTARTRNIPGRVARATWRSSRRPRRARRSVPCSSSQPSGPRGRTTTTSCEHDALLRVGPHRPNDLPGFSG